MAVKYTIRDGELVSLPWMTLLNAMEERSGHNNVNEGKRTLARQTFFWECGPSRCCCCNNCNLAAFPSPFAPHIRVGRIDHAIDFADGARAQADARALGVPAERPVPGEDWHVEVDGEALRRFHEKHGPDKWDALPRHCEFAVRRLFMHRNTARDLNHAIVEAEAKGKRQLARKLERKLKHQKRWRSFWRGRVEDMRRRADKKATRRLLTQALDATPHN
jgi:hypothetical protein